MKKKYLMPQAKDKAFITRYGVLNDTLSDPNHGNEGDEVIHYGGETGGDGPPPEAKHNNVWDSWD
ncbi:MAG: hypothetical protein IIU48_00830 [Prevotella sp.]|nr:hypothetical protein [Prevotella sp.]MBQ2522781.1 hypothetical protein [Prevotella sp.]MBQ4028025.1 hypothetical protein [Prevotella sp.]MBQ4174970.1 hypothetical protein [Prevotella sp.]MBQ5377041.1 hypothetical protein [Prevotella sp.]